MVKSIGKILVLFAFSMSGCSTKDHFGKLSDKEIIEFQLEGQLGSTRFSSGRDSIFITVSNSVYISNHEQLSATKIKVSNYATVSPQIGEAKNFSIPVTYTVTAEDLTTREYYVKVQLDKGNEDGNENIQLYNSNFDLWHDVTVNNKTFKEIGNDEEDKTWGTGNKSVASFLESGKQFPTQPYDMGSGNFAAELTTIELGDLPKVFGKGMAAGSLFVGEFDNSDFLNPHPVFGIPFTGKPKAFQANYKYMPGQVLQDGKHNVVEGDDALDIYLIIERRTEESVKRLGVGWFRSDEVQLEWKTIEIDIKYAYGVAPDGLEDYQKRVLKYGADGDSKVDNPNKLGEAKWGNIEVETPTHIFVVLTSSYQGDYFIGAPGSKLYVDNFELIYE